MAKTCSTLSQFQRSKWKRIDIEWIKNGQKMDKKYPKAYENKQKTNRKWKHSKIVKKGPRFLKKWMNWHKCSR